MKTIKFPYTMHCPSCKVGIKVKNQQMVGKRVICPKCQKKIDIVTPDEDGHVPYGVGESMAPPPDPGPSEEELEQIELERRKERREANIKTAKHIGSIIWLLILLGTCAGVFFYFFDYEKLKEKARSVKDAGDESSRPLNGSERSRWLAFAQVPDEPIPPFTRS